MVISVLLVPDSEKISSLQKALALDDRRYDVHQVLGVYLTLAGQFDEGIRHLEIAFEHEPILWVRRSYGERSIEILREAGKPQLAAKFQRKLDSLPKE